MYGERVTALALLRAGGGFVSGEALAKELGVTRAAVWKQVVRLRGLGYRIDAKPRMGYRLIAAPDLLFPEEMASLLSTQVLGRSIEYYPAVESTNDEARRLAIGRPSTPPAPEGTVVLAEEQRAGRGRRGRGWVSPPGGIWMSLILRPQWPVDDMPLLTLMSALSVARTIRRELELPASIKWPNDVLVDGRKVCGILSEVAADPDGITFAVIGIGVNANIDMRRFSREMRQEASSLEVLTGHKVDRRRLVVALFAEMEAWYLRLPEARGEMLDEWRRHCDTLGKKVAVVSGGQSVIGKAMDVDSRGGLVVELPNGELRVFASGDVGYGGAVAGP